jgi:hypothetical protein
MTAFRNLVLWGKYVLAGRTRRQVTVNGKKHVFLAPTVVQIVKIQPHPKQKSSPRNVYFVRNLSTGRFGRRFWTVRKFRNAKRVRDDWKRGQPVREWTPTQKPRNGTEGVGERPVCEGWNCLCLARRGSAYCAACLRKQAHTNPPPENFFRPGVDEIESYGYGNLHGGSPCLERPGPDQSTA